MKTTDINTLPQLPITDLDRITLGLGSHDERSQQLCVMEAVAWVAGEPHSDHPSCACPVITAFLIAWNDGLPSDAERARLLKPLIPGIVGTRAGAEVEAARSKLALDWFIQEYTPAWLELAGLKEEAALLREEPTLENCQRAREKATAARAAAWGAASDAARAAAWGAAWGAAWAAASSAASSAARGAAREKLLPTVTALQESAIALVKRMIATTDASQN